jgi:hypothetical protein
MNLPAFSRSAAHVFSSPKAIVRVAGGHRLLLFCCLLAVCCAGGFVALRAAGQTSAADLSVHEWGTFTAIAGDNGQAVEWNALAAPTDLPGFVEHFRTADFKPGLRGTVRMETPVLYFYAPHDMSVSVNVAFRKGLITEWYPRASRIRPSATRNIYDLRQMQEDGSIAWRNVRVSPSAAPELPRDRAESHYYAARETAASPLRVQTSTGEQQEKFLFYRGVSDVALPLSATLNSQGKLRVENLSEEEIPAVILFERRGEKVGYRMGGSLREEITLDPPVLNGTVDSLCGDLEGILVSGGLYPDEAHAMVETWRNSWFEEGSRLIYIVPTGFVDSVLPLNIHPVPRQTVRVFVARMEIVTPTTVRAVKSAWRSNDNRTLEKYRRFLEPIVRVIQEKDPAWAKQKGEGP